MVGFLKVCIYIQYSFDVVRNKFQTINIYTRFNKNKIKSSRKEYAIRTCFKFWPNEKHFPKTRSQWEFNYDLFTNLPKIIVACDFLQVHSNSKEVFYLSCQNRYPNLKTTCRFKLKFFLWTKLLERLLLAKYLIYIAATLIISFLRL